MPRNSYQYETSPRKYEPEYMPIRKKKVEQKKVEKQKKDAKTKYQIQKEKRKAEIKSHIIQLGIVIVVFGMLLTCILREISIMEMFNNKKDMESQLALIEKENGQVEKDIKAEESKLDWNSIKQKAETELGMKEASKISIELDRTDNVEVEETLIKDDDTSFIEKIIEKFIIK